MNPELKVEEEEEEKDQPITLTKSPSKSGRPRKRSESSGRIKVTNYVKSPTGILIYLIFFNPIRCRKRSQKHFGSCYLSRKSFWWKLNSIEI